VEPFEIVTRLTARLASTARLDELVDEVLPEIAWLGFGGVWVAVLDAEASKLSTLKNVTDGVDTTHEAPKIVDLDPRQPLGHGFGGRGMVNITDPGSLHIIERDDEAVPPDKLALSRAIYEHLRGHPFACGPLFGSRGQPVGALTVSSYLGGQPIPDAVLSHGLLRVFMDHLAIAMDRAIHLGSIERLAHDIKNLSGTALLTIGIGLRSPADAFEMLPQIERANRAIGDLVTRLQRIAWAPSSRVEDVHLPRIIDDILKMMTPVLREQSIEIDAEIAAVPLVRCDAVLIHQAVVNLVINARDALRDGGTDRRKITIRVRADGGVVRLVVADNGPGIAPDVLPHLFQRNITTKGAYHGVGLASVYAALQQFGGRIEGRNAPTGGAEFEIALIAAPPGTQAPPTEPRPHPRVPRKVRPARILAVDDDVDLVTYAGLSLEPYYEVSTATSSAQAIELATSQAFDLVLCDIGMPKQSGVDVCRSLREAGYRGKFVLMTGRDSQGLSAEQRAAGCDALIKKPFGEEVIDVIGSLLDS
jgi:CheY-like chemotaxis protein